MRLQSVILKQLNDQMILEYYASNTYLQMGAWAESRGLSGCADFLYHHAEEERFHMRKIFDYILERGGEPVVGVIESVRLAYTNVQELFEVVYEQEKTVTDNIDKIVHSAWENKDLATFSFLQWFVEEQREEEALSSEIIDKIHIIGLEGQGLYMIDEFIASKSKTIKLEAQNAGV